MKLNHMLVPAKDKTASAEFFAEIMGLERRPDGHFAPVKINESLVLDFADVNDVDLWKPQGGNYARQHYAFEVSDEEFDAIFGRIKQKGLRYGSAPGPHLYDMEINQRRGGDGRAVYFDELNGHSIELLTRSSIS
jgi:catechol 2,3-dioxygenase-like lactoylglutathione lyase family enzyme